MPAVEETGIELVVVPPGPAMPRTTGFDENVRLCPNAVSGIPNRATAAKAKTSVKRLNVRKFFSPQGILIHSVLKNCLQPKFRFIRRGPAVKDSRYTETTLPPKTLLPYLTSTLKIG